MSAASAWSRRSRTSAWCHARWSLPGSPRRPKDPEALSAWFDGLAEDAAPDDALTRLRSMALIVSLGFAMLALPGTVILPKMELIFRDLGIRAHPWLEPASALTTLLSRHAIAGALVIAIVIGLACAGIAALWWRSRRRLELGRMLLSTLAAGRAEPEIASRLALAGVATAPSMDLAGLIARCGFRSRDQAQLAHELQLAERARAARMAALVLAARIALPLVAAVPVLALGHLMFSLLVGLIEALGAGL